MPDKLDPESAHEVGAQHHPDQPIVYQIGIQGHLGQHWADWFGGLTITLLDNGDTLLTGPVIDQAALHGLLRKVRDLGMPLLSLNCIEAGHAHAPDTGARCATRSDVEP